MENSDNKIKTFFKNNKYIFVFLKQFLIVVAVYGLILNFVFTALLNLPFTFTKICALGLVAYFLKEELPDIIKSSRN